MLACWQLLSQIFVVSKISAVKIKLVAKLVLQQARGEAIDNGKIAKLLLADGKFEPHEGKGVVAALHFILTSSARYEVAEDVLAGELQQLGLPKEHAEALVAAVRDGRAALVSHFSDASLRLPSLHSLQWAVHEDAGAARAHTVELQLGLRSQPPPGAAPPPAAAAARAVNFRVSSDSLALLRAELKKARDGLAVLPRSDAD